MPKLLQTGDTVPYFTCATPSNERFSFSVMAGRYVIMCFFGSAELETVRARLRTTRQRPDLFNDDDFSFFGVTCDRQDHDIPRYVEYYPGYRLCLDYDRQVSELFGVITADPATNRSHFQRTWLILDPALRVIKNIPFRDDMSDKDELISLLESLTLPPSSTNGLIMDAPVLILPNVFEAAFCEELINLYHRHGGEESGFMQPRDGKTVGLFNHEQKRRQDHIIKDKTTILDIKQRIGQRVIPQIEKVYQYNATRIERFLVAHYGAADGGHFKAHRDNTASATRHRKFAVSINLNDAFDGGGVGFPEYSPRRYSPPKGGAMIFSCGLLHVVEKVTKGDRYACLPFLYGEEAKDIRTEGSKTLLPSSDE